MPETRPEKLTAIAKAVGHDASLFDEQDHAFLQFDGITLHLQYFAEGDVSVLVLAADLGELDAQSRIQAYALMLSANTSWRDVAGGALALDDKQQRALLMARVDLAGLTDAALAQRIYAFTRAAVHWAGKLAALAAQPGAAQAAARPGVATPALPSMANLV
ncbi:type III secretion system chaperone [Achromobacter xylosoxidans]